jgi:hypothetical protein
VATCKYGKRIGNNWLIINMEQLVQIYLRIGNMGLLTFGRESCGLPRWLKWDIDGRLGMSVKLDFGRMCGLGILA